MIAAAIASKTSVLLRLIAFNTEDQLFDKFILVTKVYDLLFLQTASNQPINLQEK